MYRKKSLFVLSPYRRPSGQSVDTYMNYEVLRKKYLLNWKMYILAQLAVIEAVKKLHGFVEHKLHDSQYESPPQDQLKPYR